MVLKAKGDIFFNLEVLYKNKKNGIVYCIENEPKWWDFIGWGQNEMGVNHKGLAMYKNVKYLFIKEKNLKCWTELAFKLAV